MANLYIIVMMQATELAVVCQMIESELFGSLLLFHGVHAVYGLVVAKVSIDPKIYAVALVVAKVSMDHKIYAVALVVA